MDVEEIAFEKFDGFVVGCKTSDALGVAHVTSSHDKVARPCRDERRCSPNYLEDLR